MALRSSLRTVKSLGLLYIFGVSLAGCDSTTAEQHLNAGQQALDNGELQKAVIEFHKSLERDPSSAFAQAQLGRALLRQGSYEDALASLQKALEFGDVSDDTLASLLQTQLALGQTQAVLNQLDELSPVSRKLSLVLADAYLASEAYEKARKIYLKFPEEPASHYGLGLLALFTQDFALARTQFQLAAEKDASHSSARKQLAELALRDNDFEAATHWFSQLAALSNSVVSGRVGLVRVKILQQDLEGAQSDLASLRGRYADQPVFSYLQGLAYFQQQAYDQAEASLLELFKMDPDHPPGLSLMGAVKFGQGEFNQAEQYVQRYRADHPQDESAAKLLASLQNQRGDIEGVVWTLKPFEDATEDPQLLGMLGSAHMRIGQFAESTTVLQRAVSLAPDLSPFRNQLALSLLAAGDKGGAEAQLKVALNRDELQFESDYLMAMVRLQQGDVAGALASADEMVRKDSGSPMGHHLHGGIALTQLDAERAVAAFSQALELDAAFVPSASALAELRVSEGDLAAAEAVWQGVLDEEPNSEAALLALARFALDAGERDQARQFIAQAAADPEAGPRSRVAQLRVLLGNGDFKAAQELATDSLDRYPNHVELMLLDSQLLLALGQTEGARDRALQVDRLAQQNDSLQPLVALALGEQLSRIGEYPAARKRLARALTGEREVSIAAEVALARIDLAKGDLGVVASQLRAMDRVSAQHPQVRLLQGDLHALGNEQSRAREIYQQLTRQGVREGLIRYVGLLTDLEEGAVAQTELRGWLSENQEDRGVRSMLANLLLSSGSNAAALEQYEALMPNEDPIALNNLAYLYFLANDPRAESVARSAYDKAQGAAEIADTLGWILVENGNPREAVALLRDSAEKLADNGTVHYHLGVAYARLGDQAKARETLQHALSMADFPESAAAKQELAQLN